MKGEIFGAETRYRYGVVGTGWRANFFLRLARQVPEMFELVAISTRDAEKALVLREKWNVPVVSSADELLGEYDPEFVVASVNRVATPDVIRTVTARGFAVLSETPPAGDLDAMRGLWRSLERPELVQVAEQYPYLPKLQAYRTVIGSGRLGDITSAQVSWTHGYHAVAMIRSLLGVGLGDAVVTARSFRSPIAESLSRDGWPSTFANTEVQQTIGFLDFEGSMGLYDFTDSQWFHPLMGRRLTVRGSRGEVVNDQVTWLADPRTPVRETLSRRETGIDGDLEGHDLDTISIGHDVVYRNPFPGARLSDEEIAIASILAQTGAWVRGRADAPYPLAEASQDHAIGLAIAQSAESGADFTVSGEPWAG